MLKRKSLRVIIAGGGTGGHLFPGIAIAEEFLRQDPLTKILFVNTGKNLERNVLSSLNFKFEVIDTEGIKGRSIFNKVKGLLKTFKAVFACMPIIKGFKPNLIVGMGGYSSGPLVLAGATLGIRTVIHEQNIIAGITNRYLSKIVDKIYLSFPNTKGIETSSKTIITGNPVRRKILDKEDIPKKEGVLRILVLGGSQGAKSVNQIVMKMLPHLDTNKFFFIHQTGLNDKGEVKEYYQKLNFNMEVEAFFYDIEEQYAKSDFIIARAGATTVAEIIALGKPSIFIPFPFAADNHQVFNAKQLVENGSALMFLETEKSLDEISMLIKDILLNDEKIAQLTELAKKNKNQNPAEIIAKDCFKLLNIDCYQERDKILEESKKTIKETEQLKVNE